MIVVPADGRRDPRDDRALLAAHVAGDPHAFGELVARHRDRLWAVALRTANSPEDAEDAVQDALVSAHRNAASYRGDAAVTTWLHRIVVNAALDRLRRNAVRPTSPWPEDERGLPSHPGHAESSVTAIVVQDALAQLPPDQRAALVLVDLQGFSVEETGRILDCAPGTVKSRCFRARARLAVLLAPALGREGDPPGGATPVGGPAQASEQNPQRNQEPTGAVPSDGSPGTGATGSPGTAGTARAAGTDGGDETHGTSGGRA
jgi:RNA polymerase sigma-70 factor (ECF subfamily)